LPPDTPPDEELDAASAAPPPPEDELEAAADPPEEDDDDPDDPDEGSSEPPEDEPDRVLGAGLEGTLPLPDEQALTEAATTIERATNEAQFMLQGVVHLIGHARGLQLR
jgi:hypothetical protein